MNLSRRRFLLLAAASGATACARPAAVPSAVFLGGGQYKTAATAPMQYVLSVIDLQRARHDLAPMTFLPHGIHAHPLQRSRLALFEKKGPGACEYDLQQQRIVRVIPTAGNRHFYGHGTYTADGAVLLSTEADRSSLDGAIGMRDSASLEYLGAFPSYGQSPHECKLIDAGRTLVVTNGGGPLQGANPSVTYIDVQSQKLLETVPLQAAGLNAGHLAVTDNGGLVVISAPRAGLEAQGNGGISLRAPHASPAALQTLQEPADVVSRMRGEALSVAVHEAADIVAVTHPDGDMVTFWRLSGRQLIKVLSLSKPRGIALSDDRASFIISSGHEARLLRVPVKTLEVDREALVERSFMTGSHLYNWAQNMAEIQAPGPRRPG